MNIPSMWVKEKLSVIVGIIAIAILEYHALSVGIDGQLFGMVIAIIGGLAGYTIKEHKIKGET